MKKEVSCVVIRGQLEYAEKAGLPLDGFLDGIPYTLDYLKSKHGRIEWDVYCRMMTNLRPAWTDAEFEQMGIGITKTVPFRNLISVGRLLFTGPEVYAFFWGASARSPGKQFFDCVASKVEQVTRNHLILTLELPPGYQYCQEFFIITRGSMRAATDVIGLGPSRVSMRRTTQGAVYRIVCPRGGAAVSRLRRAVMWPFAARTAASELKEANEALHERYAQLEEAREDAQRQAAQLKVAYDISRLIRANLDLDSTLQAIATSLVTVAGFPAVALTVDTVTDEGQLKRFAGAGVDPPGSVHIRRTLEGHGRAFGEISLALPVAPDAAQPEDLLDYVIPTISMEIDDAISFKLADDFRESLQRKVDERTLELRETNQSLKKAQAGRDRLFSNISHEFRTPLTLILGPLERILEGCRDAPMRRRLTLMQKSAGKLLQLINQLLDLSRLQSGDVKLRASETDLIPFLRGEVRRYRPLAESRRIRLTFRAEEGSLPIYLDREKAETFLNNLLVNAFKFTPDRGRIDVTARRVGVSVEVRISDSGAGIPDKELPYIFDRFYQGTSSGHLGTGGTGIGLALARELIELHHGSIRAESTNGTGTEFVICLPMGRAHLKETECVEPLALMRTGDAPGTSAVGMEMTHRKEKRIILIIDDEADVRQYVGGMFTPVMQVIEAADGEEGIRRACDAIPDIVVSDIMMQGMDGNKVCRILKKDIRTSHIPVILLTAKAGTDDRIEGLECGADDYLVKPFVARELLVRVENLIALREGLRSRFVADRPTVPGMFHGPSMEEEFLRSAAKVVENHMSDDGFGIDDFSREMGLSRSQLHRKLIALTNCSARDFLRRLRLERASELLHDNCGNVSEIAYQVGFRDPSHFARCFRKQFGVPPGAVGVPARTDLVDA